MITYDCAKTSVVADSHAYNMYLESRESQKNCYNTSISIFERYISGMGIKY